MYVVDSTVRESKREMGDILHREILETKVERRANV